LGVLKFILSLSALLLFVQPAAQQPPAWTQATKPLRLAGPIHYVGTAELAAFLIHTPQGHILIDGAVPSAAPVIEKSIRDLGFKPEDIRILLTTQAHFDHVGTHAHFKKLSGAIVQAMDGDAQLLRSGGKTDYLFGDNPAYHFPPMAVDRVLKDGDIVTLGGERLTARKTPGHTPGSTTFLMDINEGGKILRVAFVASMSVSPGTRLSKNPSYPGIREDYRKTFDTLASLKPDIFFSGHASFFNFEKKRTKINEKNPAAAFVDPQGFTQLVAEKRADFDKYVAGER
jgi:metallo-beta-lactamase class B